MIYSNKYCFVKQNSLRFAAMHQCDIDFGLSVKFETTVCIVYHSCDVGIGERKKNAQKKTEMPRKNIVCLCKPHFIAKQATRRPSQSPSLPPNSSSSI